MTKKRSYKNILDRLYCIPCPESKLNLIKVHFLNDIDSGRRFDRINNISDLLNILEKRDCLNTEDIEPLKYVARKLQNNDIIALIDAYEAEIHPNLNVCFNNDGVIPEIPTNPIERVYNLICTGIGQKWKDFARALNVPEGQIDDLEYRNQSIADKVREVLRFHRQSTDERYWKVTLCKGLEDARRKDLALKVKFIFAMHNMM